MSIKDTLNWGQNKLNQAGTCKPGLDAEVLLCNVLNTVETRPSLKATFANVAFKDGLVSTNVNTPLNKSFLYTHSEHELTDRQVKKYREYIARRQKGEPVAYITGEKQFYGLKFFVNKNVLIPRPETETLVDQAINKIQSTVNKGFKMTVVDVGTGSGCILISIIKKIKLPNYKLRITNYATDICKKALKVAEKNAHYHGVDGQIKFLQGNLLEPVINNGTTEQRTNIILVANLPYVPESKINLDQPCTRGLRFEPKKALYAGEDGLVKYREFFEQIAALKCKPKYVICEIGYEQLNGLKKIIEQYLSKVKIKVKKDLAGLNRVVVVQI